MEHREPGSRTGDTRRSLRHPAILILAASMLSMFAVAGCAHSPSEMAATAPATTSGQASGAATKTPAPVPQGGAQGMDMAPADASAAWAARPAFVNVDAQTQEAYAYALYNPQFVQWMPCYCGCAGMGHRSNLDCYLKKSVPGKPTQFEEHASFCDICVQTTLTLKRLIGEGNSLRQIRQVIDQQFGGAAPGTPTELPPA